jgi:hypothetical protein
MRFARLAAFALWLTIALLAVTGFAAFSPETVSSTTTSTTITAPLSAGADWGTTSGRVVALAFTSGLRAAPGLSDLSAEDALISDILGPRPAVTPTETEPEGAISELPASPPTTIRPTTTTASPPTTTTPNGPTTTVVPPTTTTTKPTGGRLTEADTRGIISLFFAPGDVELALQVSYCESRWDPGATNPSSDAAGLFQHLPRFWSDRSASAGWEGASIYDAHANAAVSAWLVYDGGGWVHWTASKSCWG